MTDSNILQILFLEEIQRLLVVAFGVGLTWWAGTVGKNIFAGFQIRSSDLYQSASARREFYYQGKLCRVNICRSTYTVIINEDNLTWRVSNTKFLQLEKWEVFRELGANYNDKK